LESNDCNWTKGSGDFTLGARSGLPRTG
jgi:hypothetical protein